MNVFPQIIIDEFEGNTAEFYGLICENKGLESYWLADGMVLIYYVSCVQKIDSAWCAARIQFIIIIPIKAFQRKPCCRLVHVFLLSFCICSFHLPVSIFPCA